MKTRKYFSAHRCMGVLTLLTAAGMALSQAAAAQAPGPVEKLVADSSTSSSSANTASSASGAGAANANAKANANANAELIKELEQMRRRIEQLEAQLKAQADAKQPQPSLTEEATLVNTSAVVSSDLTVRSGQAAAEGQQPTKAEDQKPAEPFAYADWTWLNGNPRTKQPAFDSKFFTPEIRADVNYTYSFNHPSDDTIGGSSEVFRSAEFQLTQFGAGGDFHYDNVQARLMTQFGMYSATTPRNDASPARGNWDLDTAYRYLAEAYGGYHFNALHGINAQAGIFMSYVGLFSYYNFDNWAYQPSYVSSNTPWFFNGMRVQIFPTDKLKIEPWLINGWQSYGRFNNRPGVGGQILWRPTGWLSILGNQYALGEDTLFTPGRVRYHTDDSIQVKYYDNQNTWISKAAFSLTGDMGCEHGGGVSCTGNSTHIVNGQTVVWPKQSFLGVMAYNRLWFHKDLYGLTLGGGKINNPGRYLVLLPPINGATARSGTPYFTENPGDPYKAWDISTTFDYMPSQYITFRWEYNHRAASVPYFSGPGGVTPPGGNQGTPGSFVCLSGFTSCDGSATNTWLPDLRKTENRATIAILVKF